MLRCCQLKLLVFALLIMSLSFGSMSCGKKGPPKVPRWEEPPAVDSEFITWVGAELQIGALGVARAGTNLINAPTD